MIINPTLQCPCGAEYLKEVYQYSSPPKMESNFNLRGSEYKRSFDQCKICHHIFGRHDIDLSELYSEEYVTATYGDCAGMLKRFKHVSSLPKSSSDNFFRVDAIHAFLKVMQNNNLSNGRRLLDIGAGIGVFPYAMKALGWEVLGVEPDKRTARHLRENLGINCISEDFFNVSSSVVGKFNLISLNKVLEHLENPALMLNHARDFLESNGLVYIEVPDIEASLEGFFREEFFIEHHHVFSETSLCSLIRRAELNLLRIDRLREPSGKYTLRAFANIG